MELKDQLRDGSHLRSAQYRRGTIMGLTVAESFILLAFILLLLLMLWRIEGAERREKVNDTLRAIDDGARLVEEKTLLNLLEEVERLPPAQRGETVDKALEIIEKFDPDDLPSVNNMLHSMERGARLVEEETLLSLLEEVEKLPPAQRDAIVKLVSVEGYEDVIAWARKIAALMEQGYSFAEIENALEIAKQRDLASAEALKSQIRRRFEEVEETERLVAEEIEQATGPFVREVGGAIDPFSGVVTIPDALFQQGRSDITPTLARFLDDFCVEWLGALKKYGHSIESVRIEGHASSEWKSESAQTAFLENMELSQARASNVLERCLILSGAGELGQWGRSKLVAVGRSSAQLVTTPEGHEDRIQSRRVVFRFEVDKEHILREIQEDVQASDAAIKP